eukprot:TRINITY_DN65061_c0_g1_i1.p1 TRINITY_DN65061_c0_g1~~TRINITY_DN65061_c0_g1_i1.p1  ORF type:complete len:449 (+),score=79.80 TRINITY_DN65061_c0_g1_i1:170-1516(+)
MGQQQTSCCGARIGQPSIINIGDDPQPPLRATSTPQGISTGSSGVALPGWMAELEPHLQGEEAAHAAEAWEQAGIDLRRRTRSFLRRAMAGSPCRLVDPEIRRAIPARYTLLTSSGTLRVETIVSPSCMVQTCMPEVPKTPQRSPMSPARNDVTTTPIRVGMAPAQETSNRPSLRAALSGFKTQEDALEQSDGKQRLTPRTPLSPTFVPQKQMADRPWPAVEARLADIHNVWLCTDSELARRAHRFLRHGSLDADPGCMMLIDVPSGPIGIVERTAQAREDMLDCLAPLIAAERLRQTPEIARCRTAGLPPPEAKLRAPGRSLQSAHLFGPICAWLAQVGEDALESVCKPDSPTGFQNGMPEDGELYNWIPEPPEFEDPEVAPEANTQIESPRRNEHSPMGPAAILLGKAQVPVGFSSEKVVDEPEQAPVSHDASHQRVGEAPTFGSQ